MKITSISIQAKNKDRVNVSVDGKYRFSLDVFQLVDLGIKVGKDYSEEELIALETESQFGKLYTRALEYTMLRPHSAREIRDYLWRKTRTTKRLQKRVTLHPKKGSSSNSSEESASRKVIEIPGVSQEIADRVYDRLVEKGYIDDEKFTRYWVENRSQTKGASRRKLIAELRAKGVENTIIEAAFENTERNDEDELAKIIAKKRARYPDDQKFMQYLARQGFSYDDIKSALSDEQLS